VYVEKRREEKLSSVFLFFSGHPARPADFSQHMPHGCVRSLIYGLLSSSIRIQRLSLYSFQEMKYVSREQPSLFSPGASPVFFLANIQAGGKSEESSQLPPYFERIRWASRSRSFLPEDFYLGRKIQIRSFNFGIRWVYRWAFQFRVNESERETQ
jgi:hypothetical protein